MHLLNMLPIKTLIWPGDSLVADLAGCNNSTRSYGFHEENNTKFYDQSYAGVHIEWSDFII